MRKLIYIVLAIVLVLKGVEVFVAQPMLMTETVAELKKLEPRVQIKSIETAGRDISIKHLTVASFADPVDIKGTMVLDLFGKPTIRADFVPTGSQLWHVDRVMGDVSVWFDAIHLKNATILNLYSLDAPTMVIPRVDVDVRYDKDQDRLFVDASIPQFGGGVTGAQLRVKGEVLMGDNPTGKFIVTVVNPGAVVDFLADLKLFKPQQILAIKGLTGGANNQKSEISLPLSYEQGALYLGPIRLYPRSSKEDILARVAGSDVASLFRSFGRALQ